MDRQKYPKGIPREFVENQLEEEVLFKGTIGFDFVFYLNPLTGKKEPYCIELNGKNSGNGIATGTKGLSKIFHYIRSEYSMEFQRKQAFLTGFENDINKYKKVQDWEGFKYKYTHNPSKYLKGFKFNSFPEAVDALRGMRIKFNRKIPMFQHANNDEERFYEFVNNKENLRFFVPEEFCPPTYKFADFEKQYLMDGIPDDWDKIVLKPRDGLGGRNVRIFTRKKFREFMDTFENEDEDYLENYVVQKYIENAGADILGEKESMRPACSRYLVDFTVTKSGKIFVEYAKPSNRVAKFPAGKNSPSENFVVNVALGASVVDTSPLENELAYAAVDKILRKTVDVYLKVRR